MTVFLVVSACSTQEQAHLNVTATDSPLYQDDDWVHIPSGEFLMGSTDAIKEAADDEKPQHTVKVTRPFKIARYEVTFENYDRFAKATHRAVPSDSGFALQNRSKLPVINVSWDDAVAYAAWLSGETNRHFRLPTEAEWEYAARAGTTTTRFWGDDRAKACEYANVFDLRNEDKIRLRFSVPKIWAANHACSDAHFAIAPVGSFKANAWGLYDMLGNVWEWVQDCSHTDYINAPTQADISWQTENKGNCAKRGVRGGSWFVAPNYVRVANRSWNPPTDRGTGLGFRLVQD